MKSTSATRLPVAEPPETFGATVQANLVGNTFTPSRDDATLIVVLADAEADDGADAEAGCWALSLPSPAEQPAVTAPTTHMATPTGRIMGSASDWRAPRRDAGAPVQHAPPLLN